MVRGLQVWVNPAKPAGHSLLWQDDAVELAIKAMTLGQVPPLVLNFGGSEPVSIEEYCTYAGELLGIAPRFRYTDETYPGNFMDPTLMRKVLGEPKVGWREGIRRLVEHRYPDMIQK
jgi:nucleoside-diphosphate-sugar epimerase